MNGGLIKPLARAVSNTDEEGNKTHYGNRKWKCLDTNAQSIINKMPELLYEHSTNDYDIIGITESWCTEDILESEISIPGMNCYRKDRGSKGGGALLYVKKQHHSPRSIWPKTSKHCRLSMVRTTN